MAQYDLLLTQNVAASGVEFEEKYVNIGDKELLVGGASGALAKIAKTNAAGKILKSTNADGTFSWQDNDGTVQDTFQIGVSGVKLKKSATAGQMDLRNAADNALADLQLKELIATSIKLAGAGENGKITYGPDANLIPSSGEGLLIRNAANTDYEDIVAERFLISNWEGITLPQEATSKKYVDDAITTGFTTNDAMVFKGTVVDAAAVPTTGFKQGWTYRATAAFTLGTSGTPTNNITVEIGDLIICYKDHDGSYNIATNVTTYWTAAQTNIDGAVTAANNFATDQVLVGAGANKTAKVLAATTNGYVLKLVAGVPTWASHDGFANPMTASGDIIYGGTAGAPTRLPKGTNGEVLKLVDGLPAWGTDTSYTHPNHSGDVTSVGDGAQTIAAGAVTLGKMANLAALSVIGNKTGNAATPVALDKIDLAALLLQVIPGLVITPPASATAAGTINEMRADNNFLYRCIQTGTAGNAKWVRTPFAKWTA